MMTMIFYLSDVKDFSSEPCRTKESTRALATGIARSPKPNAIDVNIADSKSAYDKEWSLLVS